MNDLCPECQDKSFDKINNVFSYDIPTRHSKLSDPETVNLMKLEEQRAQDYLQEYFEKIYHKVVD
jgi:uncharacterized alpha/beta hydrolase family protein